jgi:predicted Rossmann fold flavoprotein
MSTPRIIVIGGGAAGMLAAGRAAQCGAKVTLLERGRILGSKLRISGKGRCNITNTADIAEFVEAFGPNGKFLYGAFSRFFRDDLLELLREQGVETKVERGGRIFPVSDSAGDVAAALERWLTATGVKVKLNSRVKSLEIENGRVVGVKLYAGEMKADAVVIATGGASYPKTGSSGDGYTFAKAAGHTIIPQRPALSALVTREAWVKEAQGLALKNVEATLFSQAEGEGRPRKIASEFGEMLFTHFGVSGPIILTLSRGVGELLKNGGVFISLDLKPALSREQLQTRLIKDFAQKKYYRNYLRELLPLSLIEPFVKLSEMEGDKPVNLVTAPERKQIIELLKDLRVTVANMAPLEEAIVTAGGVAINEINPRTMMSKLVEGLFFAGEVIDIDAKTGGFNLQAAFSTGYVAGEACASQ